MAPLLVLDGDSLAHRAYHSLPRTVRDGRGEPANMIVGFTNMLVGLWQMERPRTVLACWDTLTAPTYRHELLPGYQSGREFPDDLVAQLDRLPDLVAALGLANAKGPGYEADDFLAAAASQETARGGQTTVVTSDRDAYQVVSDHVTILRPLTGISKMERIRLGDVRERYGVEPALVPDFIALRGDPSDRIPGAPGIGPKKAASILARCGSLEGAIAAGGLAGLADDLRMYRRIAEMQVDAPVPPLPDREPDWAGAAALASDWGLKALADRLTGLGMA